jgi:hypothetical protein
LFSKFAPASAQSLYHLEYSFTPSVDSTTYHAFLVFFEDGSGLIRIRFQHNKEDIVLEADTDEPLPLPNDSTGSLIGFINPRVVVGNPAFASPLPWLAFSLDKNSGFSIPSAIYRTKAHMEEKLPAPVFNGTHIESHAMQKNFLLQFFNEDDEFYRSIFQPATRSLSEVEKNTRLHLLIVANTNEKIIGGSCALDKERTLQTFTDLSKFLGIRLIVDSVTGKNYGKKMWRLVSGN